MPGELIKQPLIGLLLEQHTPDVFSTNLGNLPPYATVNVQIEYIMELKHDSEVNGPRFTIPTSIAPRYGDPPSGLTANTGGTISISVQISVLSNFTSVPVNICPFHKVFLQTTAQSPSHPISIFLGAHSENALANTFNPHHALATLGQTSTELGKGFILVKCANLSSPNALLKTHPTIPNLKALMLTLIPKFNLPERVPTVWYGPVF
jgi:hypothetical protein